jgi:hypothetical protein
LLLRLIEAGAEAIEPDGPDPVTESLDAIADELAASPSVNVGRSLIATGAWEW